MRGPTRKVSCFGETVAFRSVGRVEVSSQCLIQPRGTGSSNPSPSSGESANPRSLSRRAALAGIVYLAAVQLSHNPSTQVLEGRPSRSLGQGRPSASIPLRVSRAPSAGMSTVHIPYGWPGTLFGWVWTRNGSPILYHVSAIRSSRASRRSVRPDPRQPAVRFLLSPAGDPGPNLI